MAAGGKLPSTPAKHLEGAWLAVSSPTARVVTVPGGGLPPSSPSIIVVTGLGLGLPLLSGSAYWMNGGPWR